MSPILSEISRQLDLAKSGPLYSHSESLVFSLFFLSVLEIKRVTLRFCSWADVKNDRFIFRSRIFRNTVNFFFQFFKIHLLCAKSFFLIYMSVGITPSNYVQPNNSDLEMLFMLCLQKGLSPQNISRPNIPHCLLILQSIRGLSPINQVTVHSPQSCFFSLRSSAPLLLSPQHSQREASAALCSISERMFPRIERDRS